MTIVTKHMKSEINQVLKDHNYQSIKFKPFDSFESKVIPKTKSKGIPGASIGPMDTTNHYLNKNKKIENELQHNLKLKFDANIQPKEDSLGFNTIIPFTANKDIALDCKWIPMPTYPINEGMSSYYITYWLIIEKSEIKRK